MIIAYLDYKTMVPQEITSENKDLLKNALWIDLYSPSKTEEALVEERLQIGVPTRDEMVEIELSSRLYKENNVIFMTVMMMAQPDTLRPKIDPVTCILTQKQLITVRYIEPQSFKLFIALLKKLTVMPHDPTVLLIELLEANVDCLADMLELVGRNLDEYSKTLFQPHQPNTVTKIDYRKLMLNLGANDDLNTNARESLVSFIRLIPFFSQSTNSRLDADAQVRLATLSKDISALTDHATFISNKVIFFLDATLGLVSIEQNKIIKVVSVAAVIFLPPTIIASIYGMNFHFMPELSWKYGYLFALGLMIFASWLPYQYFKSRKWL